MMKEIETKPIKKLSVSSKNYIMIGFTGDGKSTLINGLIGNQMKF